MEQGRLAGPRGCHKGDQLARPDREIGAAQDLERALALLVAALDAREEKGRHGLSAAGIRLSHIGAFRQP